MRNTEHSFGQCHKIMSQNNAAIFCILQKIFNSLMITQTILSNNGYHSRGCHHCHYHHHYSIVATTPSKKQPLLPPSLPPILQYSTAATTTTPTLLSPSSLPQQLHGCYNYYHHSNDFTTLVSPPLPLFLLMTRLYYC